MRQGLPLLCALVLLAVPFSAEAQSAEMTTPESALLRAMNHARADHGLPALKIDRHLQLAAVAHSREMIASNTFEHGAFGTRMQEFNVTYSLAGENIAWGTGRLAKARAIVAEWLASPEHRRNLLRPTFTRVGVGDLVGAFQGYDGAHVVTTDFAN
jgi:uncharacterized protein YkwD